MYKDRYLRAAMIGCSLILSQSNAKAEETQLETLVVQGHADEENATLKPEETAPQPVDLAELLRRSPGITASRMGGQGLDVIMRGQSDNRLQIVNDGLFIEGGCPNRMDPPTLYSSPSSLDRVTIIPGKQTLEYGAGGGAGTLILEQDNWSRQPGLYALAALQSNSNGLHSAADMDALWRGERGFFRLNGEVHNQGNYQDGNGDKVRSAFKKRGTTASAGYQVGEHRITAKLAAMRDRDTLYAGAGMDSPQSDMDSWQFAYRYEPENINSLLNALQIEHGESDVTHVMDNFSLRPLSMSMPLSVPSHVVTSTSRMKVDFQWTDVQWLMGIDRIGTRKNAVRYTGMNSQLLNLIQSRLWPDVHQSESGIFVQGYRESDVNRFKAGVRLDRLQSTAHAATQAAGNPAWPSALDLYRQYYGGGVNTQWNENKLSLFAGFSRQIHDQTSLYANWSHSWRMPNASELFLAAFSPMSLMRWVGNPNLKAELHQQLDLGGNLNLPNGNLTVNLWLDNVQDYVLRDRAHGQPGILQQDNASIYRNVDARLYGLGLVWDYKPVDDWSMQASVDYTHGQNRTDDRPLPRIPPLSGSLDLSHAWRDWNATLEMDWASAQHRVDDNPMTGSGLDAGPGKGWATLHFNLQWQMNAQWKLALRGENLLDQTYAYHVNRANADPFNPEALRVNEPGRTLWLQLQWSMGK